MIKRTTITALILLLTIALASVLSGCESEEAEQPEEQVDYEIALIADDSLINDGGSSEVLWNAITDFAAGHGLSHKYYKAAEASDNAFTEAIDNAVDNGAKVIIADESAISDVIYDEQAKYKDVKFVLLNADPYDEDNGDILIGENTAAVTFATEQAGFLAGYTAVKEGYTQLGFIGENDEKNIRNYAIGFAKGANRAAREEGIELVLKYHVCEDDSATAEAEETADDWFKGDTELIFTCGHKIENMVIGSAENNGGKVIGGMTDKGQISDTVIVSAVENLDKAVSDMLQKYSDNKFPGGEIQLYDASNSGIGLELKNSRLEYMDKSEYDSILEALASGDIRIRSGSKDDISNLDLKYVTVIK